MPYICLNGWIGDVGRQKVRLVTLNLKKPGKSGLSVPYVNHIHAKLVEKALMMYYGYVYVALDVGENSKGIIQKRHVRLK